MRQYLVCSPGGWRTVVQLTAEQRFQASLAEQAERRIERTLERAIRAATPPTPKEEDVVRPEDIKAIATAIVEAIRDMPPPTIPVTVNVPEQPAPQVTVVLDEAEMEFVRDERTGAIVSLRPKPRKAPA